jgi:hypothetical protein
MVFSAECEQYVLTLGYGQFTGANAAFSPHQHRNSGGLYYHS